MSHLFYWPAILVASLIPLLMGFIYYHPKTMGTLWMKEAHMTEDKMKGANMAMIFVLSLIFSFLLVIALHPMVIHQMGVFSVVEGVKQSGDAAKIAIADQHVNDFMQNYGHEFRTFKHGAFHGFIYSLFLVFPILAINSMFERDSWKLIFINTSFWALCLMLMGGIISGWHV